MNTTAPCRITLIANLNDRCRVGLDRTSKTMFTQNCLASIGGGDTVTGLIAGANLLKAIRRYEFKPGDGPERDYGSLEFAGERICFKIDYYDPALEYGSEDPADASVTRRVMTIMLVSDY
ncbi:DUF3768 domain-containing protein [Sphingomonas xinjiangensis]|uniref:DUF3768 domain-containing protein n=1 Tax=Sphingomonas xinjiangensis TaxID=643568 RepID=A0A840YRT4_9SPHN|nr:DUF3768 domain-containing protein [Sphingomonas xinjiangensis]MBB5712384.1 hypothetical protein [Sphingomonas xinjiangensis]